MRRSWTIGLLSMLGLGLVCTFSCSQKDDDDDTYTPGLGTGGKASTKDDDDDTGTGTGTGSTSDDDDDSKTEPEACENIQGLVDEECLSQVRGSEPIPVNMLLLIDKSGSMKDASTYGQPKWQALTSALSDALNADTMIDNPQMSVGLLLFPGEQVTEECDPEDCCALPSAGVNVDIDSASKAVGDIVDTLESVTPSGLTPTAAALSEALAYFQTGNGSMLEGDNYVLLATDGGPNCNDALTCGDDECTISLDGRCSGSTDCCSGSSNLWCVDWQETLNQIEVLADNNVKTIVVGIPGSEQYTDWLNDFAKAGKAEAPTADDDGGASYYEVSASGGVSALKKTFEDITINLVRSCRIQLKETTPSVNGWLVNVALDCQAIPQGGTTTEGGAGAGGEVSEKNWIIDESTDPPTIEILGQYCDKIQKGVERLDIVIGCPPRL